MTGFIAAGGFVIGFVCGLLLRHSDRDLERRVQAFEDQAFLLRLERQMREEAPDGQV